MDIILEQADIENLIRRYYGDRIEILFKSKNIKIVLKTNTDDVIIRNTIKNEKTTLMSRSELTAPEHKAMGTGEENRNLIQIG